MKSVGDKRVYSSPGTDFGITYREWLIGQTLANVKNNSVLAAQDAIDLADSIIRLLDKEIENG